jgi:hypothetical protein
MNQRNEHRFRQKSGRARTNALNGMTPQGEAIWCAEHIENASGFNPEIIPEGVNSRKLDM